MTIPNLPAFFDMQYTTKDGKLAPDGYLYNDQTFQVSFNTLFTVNNLASTLFVNIAELQPPALNPGINAPALLGINPPSFTAVQIAAIAALAAPNSVPLGTLWYDSTNDVLKFMGKTGVQTINSFY